MKLQENVLRRVRMVEEKGGINYAKTDGKLYRTLGVLYTLLFIYTMGINLIFISGMFLVHGGTDSFASISNTLITVCVCTGVIIAGFIFTCFKFNLIGGILSVVPEVFLILSFGTVMTDSLGLWGFNFSFYYRHFVPLLLMIVFMVWACVIALRAKIKTEKQYKKVIDNLYVIYNKTSSEVTDEQWNEFLNNYDPKDYTKLFKANETKEDAPSDQ